MPNETKEFLFHENSTQKYNDEQAVFESPSVSHFVAFFFIFAIMRLKMQGQNASCKRTLYLGVNVPYQKRLKTSNSSADKQCKLSPPLKSNGLRRPEEVVDFDLINGNRRRRVHFFVEKVQILRQKFFLKKIPQKEKHKQNNNKRKTKIDVKIVLHFGP